MKGIVLGTAGHVDHGKTALVRALTGVETDRWAEERERGLTIDIGFAPLHVDADLEVGVVDVPGHEDFVKNMLVGSTGIDAVLLVVAADEGPMPQTREHLSIARLLGVRHGIVALNKVDRVEPEWRELARDATLEESGRILGHRDWPVVEVSTLTGEGLTELREHILDLANELPARPEEDVFRMPVDRAFSVAGAGTVVTGTTWSGRVTTGDTVRLLPVDLRARVRSLQVHGSDRDSVGPGSRAALALVGVETSRATRGAVVVSGAAWRSHRRFGARIEVPPESPREIRHGQRVRVFLGTGEVMARVLTERRETVARGTVAWALVDCETPVVARTRDRFILRFYSPVVTIAGGQVAERDPPRAWRRRLESWRALLDGSPSGAIHAAVALAGPTGLAAENVPLASGVPAALAKKTLESSARLRRVRERWFDGDSLDQVVAAVRTHLKEAHRSRPRASAESLESVRQTVGKRFSSELVDAVVTELAERGVVVVSGPGIRLPDHAPVLRPAEQDALESLRSVLESARLEPPPPAELAARVGVERDLLNDLLRLLVEQREIVAITPEIYVTRDAESEARRVVRTVAGHGSPASPAEFRAALTLTRKYLIPLLEHMDRNGVTRRTPQGRVAEDR